MCHVILPQPVVCHLPKGDASPHRISRHYNLLDHRTLGLSLLPDESGACANTQKIRLQCTSKTPEISLVYPPGYYPIADFGEGSLVQVSPATEMSLPGTCVLSDQSVATFSAGNVTSDEVTIGCANADLMTVLRPLGRWMSRISMETHRRGSRLNYWPCAIPRCNYSYSVNIYVATRIPNLETKRKKQYSSLIILKSRLLRMIVVKNYL
jgi:hypothetical protein